jgi:uncharacterized membrane protein
MQDFHPILVHIPVAVIPLTVLFGLWRLTNLKSKGLTHAFRACLVVAVAFSMLANWTGDKAEEPAEKIVPAELLDSHERLGTYTMWLVEAALLVEAATLISRLAPWTMPLHALAFVITLGSLLTVAMAGHRGAQMVYKYGAGVGEVFGPSPNVTVAPAAGSGGGETHGEED